MTVSKCTGKVQFKEPGLGVIAVEGVLPDLSPSFHPGGQTVSVNVGGVQETFTLDARGSARSDGHTSAFAGGATSFKLTLMGSDFAAALGLDPSAAIHAQLTAITISVTLDGIAYVTDFAAQLTSVPNKQAMFR
jgi:hypothetical protein